LLVLGKEGNQFAKLGIVQGNGVLAEFQAELKLREGDVTQLGK
jgi:hypothetical protein